MVFVRCWSQVPTFHPLVEVPVRLKYGEEMGLFGSSLDATFDQYVLRGKAGTIKKTRGSDKGTHPLTGVTATVESAEDLHRRVTATRVLMTGVFALALKKKAGGTSFLTIEGPGFAWVSEIDRKSKGKAIEFAAKVRAAASASG